MPREKAASAREITHSVNAGARHFDRASLAHDGDALCRCNSMTASCHSRRTQRLNRRRICDLRECHSARVDATSRPRKCSSRASCENAESKSLDRTIGLSCLSQVSVFLRGRRGVAFASPHWLKRLCARAYRCSAVAATSESQCKICMRRQCAPQLRACTTHEVRRSTGMVPTKQNAGVRPASAYAKLLRSDYLPSLATPCARRETLRFAALR